MKEIALITQDHDQVQQQLVKKVRKIGNIDPQPGHTLFEYDSATGIMRLATYEAISMDGHTRRVKVREGCIYESALNRKNAAKKICRQFNLKLLPYIEG